MQHLACSHSNVQAFATSESPSTTHYKADITATNKSAHLHSLHCNSTEAASTTPPLSEHTSLGAPSGQPHTGAVLIDNGPVDTAAAASWYEGIWRFNHKHALSCLGAGGPAPEGCNTGSEVQLAAGGNDGACGDVAESKQPREIHHTG